MFRKREIYTDKLCRTCQIGSDYNYNTRKSIDNETANITDNTINNKIINAYNDAQTTESEIPQIEYKGLNSKNQPYWTIRNIQMFVRRYIW